jgi:hypothetical protein
MRRSKATHCGDDLGVPATVPTFSVFVGCCALAAIGHAAAVPPRSVMNARRFMLISALPLNVSSASTCHPASLSFIRPLTQLV